MGSDAVFHYDIFRLLAPQKSGDSIFIYPICDVEIDILSPIFLHLYTQNLFS